MTIPYDTTTYVDGSAPAYNSAAELNKVQQGILDAGAGYYLCTSSTRPGSPDTGQPIYETDTGAYLIYDGSAWVYVFLPWTTWTPAWSNVTIGNGVSAGRYRLSHGTIEWQARLDIGSSTSISSQIELDAPAAYTLDLTSSLYAMSTWIANDTSASNTRYAGVGWTASTSQLANRIALDGTVLGWDATDPFTWASGDYLMGQGSAVLA